MSNTHFLLRGKNNLLIITIWAIAAVGCTYLLIKPIPWELVILGCLGGALGGFLQLRSIAEGADGFFNSSTPFGVERALYATTWGKLYMALLLICVLSFFVIGFVIYGNYMAGSVSYFWMALIRECVTLKASFRLDSESNKKES